MRMSGCRARRRAAIADRAVAAGPTLRDAALRDARRDEMRRVASRRDEVRRDETIVEHVRRASIADGKQVAPSREPTQPHKSRTNRSLSGRARAV
ncbi:hypothetical protein [Burkholderia oklahomensis]|uniref:hypothetical protein n=1 Tax=Burkholderia oklahomensis TaxID=342113 RepID=UPI00016A2723|nr:hypothetical protein [Burkholderia oklahomensis]AOI39533.1 hypothetical protein WG70_07760 [Burkholderia oklahomensis EO147]AOI49212.1 hypothetical protein WI23_25830 [Burkholderia oklahomensis C6786]KUY51466.1 hypothetical protein WG70_16110 [Burkholderia oklahomensis EO147]KUY60739.1 hypothetical protein WI23_13670 [Burkholderia oklahomensis C6786]MBI0362548.1 hypothetical protein [Burkholderia oklahomensis]